MITNVEEWYYIALKSIRIDDGFDRPIITLSKLFRGVTANHHGDFDSLNCLHSFRTDNVQDMKDWLIIMTIAMQKCLPKVITQ